MGELWELLLSAQASENGIPESFTQQKKEEIKKRMVCIQTLDICPVIRLMWNLSNMHTAKSGIFAIPPNYTGCLVSSVARSAQCAVLN